MAPSDIYDRVIAEVERPLIRLTLAATRGNQIKAAVDAGAEPQHVAQEDPRPGDPGGARHRMNDSGARRTALRHSPVPLRERRLRRRGWRDETTDSSCRT